MIIDSHQHFWQVGRFEYPWLTKDLGVLYRDYLPAEFMVVLTRNNVSKSVLVQASNSMEESRWLLKLADENEFIAGVVGWVDLTDSELDAQLDELTGHPKFKGVRHLVESEPADDWLVQPEVLRGLNCLATYNVSYDLLVHTRHLKYLPKLIDRCPTLRLVIDHMAKPQIMRGEIREWSKGLRAIASHANVYCKLSGLVTEASHTSWKTSDLRPYVDIVLELFGTDRLFFGSDYPVCLLAATYDRVLESLQEILAHLNAEDALKIFNQNSAGFYRLNTSD